MNERLKRMAMNSFDDSRSLNARPAGTSYSGPPLSQAVRPEGLALLIDQAARSVYTVSDNRGLTPAQWAVLRYLKRARNTDPTMMGLVRYQKIAPATASETISLLVKRGLLEKERDPNDRRQYLLRLTDEAEKLVQHDPLLKLSQALSELDDATLSCMADGIEQVLFKIVGAPGEKPPETSAARPGQKVD
jgi:DNA-binding MarR family transcriptional regulator